MSKKEWLSVVFECPDTRGEKILRGWLRFSGFIFLGMPSLILAGAVLDGSPAAAQTDPVIARPYASMNRDAVSYSGPGRGADYDLPGNTVTIGIVVPLQGSQAAEGGELLEAARLALDEESLSPMPDGRQLALAVGDQSGQWGQASNEIVRLITQDHAVALITSPDGSIAHQAEQVSNKIGIPILTLASDATTTEINIPWIFRLGPSDAEQARVFAREIYQERGFQRVVLVVQAGHDGREGGDEFEKAARRLRASPPNRVEFEPAVADMENVPAQIHAQNPEAIALWADSDSAAKLIPLLRRANPSVPVYLCRKAAPFVFDRPEKPSREARTTSEGNGAGIWIVASPSSAPGHARQEFERRFRVRTGRAPSIAAAQAYDAVHVIATALRRAGPNRARLRDQLAHGPKFEGASGMISFDAAGNTRGEISVVKLQSAPGTAAAF
jgi:branched-chain amino acid transport system substrate-binding protein